MHYHFKRDFFNQACELWKEGVMAIAEKQPGFVRMQFLTDLENRAMAIGTWQNRTDAEKFMQTGVFRNLMSQIKDFIEEDPQPKVWELRYYAEKR